MARLKVSSSRAKRAREKKIVKSDLIDLVYNKQFGYDQVIFKFFVEDIIDCFLDTVGDALVRGEKVELRNFAVFHPLKNAWTKSLCHDIRKAKHFIGWQFHNSKVFKPSKILLDRMNGGEYGTFEQYFSSDTDT